MGDDEETVEVPDEEVEDWMEHLEHTAAGAREWDDPATG